MIYAYDFVARKTNSQPAAEVFHHAAIREDLRVEWQKMDILASKSTVKFCELGPIGTIDILDIEAANTAPLDPLLKAAGEITRRRTDISDDFDLFEALVEKGSQCFDVVRRQGSYVFS